MMTLIDLRKKKTFDRSPSPLRPETQKIDATVTLILRQVREQGDAAVRRYTKTFDGVALRSFAVSAAEIRRARRSADPRFVSVLQQAIKNIRRFHAAQVRKPFSLDKKTGAELRQIYRPVENVGVYIPGGKAVYPSTVLMNVIPAQIAGVKNISLVSPPDRSGNVHPDVLLAASLLGVKNIFRIGGAQAIAALAYGTESIPAVDMIVGPGNIFVATAKRLVYGTVGIDSVAGPSEVVILADGTADPDFVASDLLAQAEHDEQAVPVLVTTSRKLSEQVQRKVRELLLTLPRQRIIEKALRDHGRIYLVSSIRNAAEITNILAPEHLEIITADDESVLPLIRNAGSVFLGNYSPVALGDYFAGPNHVLPTGRTARFFSPLSVDHFVKRSSVVRYSRKKMVSVADDVALFAEREGLTAHALSVQIRK